VDKWVWEVGGRIFEKSIATQVLQVVGHSTFDVAFVCGGEFIGPELVRRLKSFCGAVINYNLDDPFGRRDKQRWQTYLRAAPFYDLLVVVRDCNVAEAKERGAKNVIKVFRTADEVAHAPRALTEADRLRWSTEVVFIGTWMPERGSFLARLVQLGVPLTIFGNRWERAPERNLLSQAWRGIALDDDYAKAIQCSKVAIGLLSKGNRDLSTLRTFEIPHLGAVLCAERTPEHLMLYRENEEALFWSSPEECAGQCHRVLKDPSLRSKLALQGQRRCIANQTTNEKSMTRILETIDHNGLLRSA
jgi:hypothetical protein